jgi:hypothetical protein
LNFAKGLRPELRLKLGRIFGKEGGLDDYKITYHD